MFRVSSEAKFLEAELPGCLALSISEVLKALPAAPSPQAVCTPPSVSGVPFLWHLQPLVMAE